ncbi:MAG: hypothetical protein E7058_07160 [Lentisphaerae bacterium]|nr:hypothetical protein [Lentisphaerota bacterium]
MKTFLTIFITALLIVPELFCGNVGLALGLPIFAALFFSGSFGIAYGIAAAGCAGLTMDLLYARPLLCSAPVWILITFAAGECAMRLRMRTPEAPLAAGFIIGTMQLIWNILYALTAGTPFPGPDIFSMLIFQAVGGSIFMLLLTLLFDAVNFRCNLPRFSPPENNRQDIGRRI